MPECTKAEREYLDTLFGHFDGDDDASEVVAAYTAVLAERRAAEQGSVTPTNEAHEDEYARQVAEARIASLEAALAEERAKPKEGAVRHRVVDLSTKGLPSARVEKEHLGWMSVGPVLAVQGHSAESLAREHAARLQAEHEKGGAV